MKQTVFNGTNQEKAAKIAQIAKLLGKGWTFKEDKEINHWTQIDHVNGGRIGFSFGYKGDVEASVRWPSYWKENSYASFSDWKHVLKVESFNERIGFSFGKDVEKIVSDIKKRLQLDLYLELLPKCKAYKDAQNNKHEQRQQITKDLFKLVPSGVMHNSQHYKVDENLTRFESRLGINEANVQYHGDVELELQVSSNHLVNIQLKDLSKSQAAKLLKFLAKEISG